MSIQLSRSYRLSLRTNEKNVNRPRTYRPAGELSDLGVAPCSTWETRKIINFDDEICFASAPLAQLVERGTSNAEVAGSTPSGGTDLLPSSSALLPGVAERR